MTVDIYNRTVIRPISIVAGIVAAIQAAVWVSLSLISILFYNDVLVVDTTLSLHSYQYILYEYFLSPNNTNDKLIVTPEVFHTLMVCILTSNFLWLLVSLWMVWVMTRDKWKYLYPVVGGWSALTIFITIFDIVLMGLVVADYVTIQDLSNQLIVTTTTTNSPGTSIATTTIEPSTTTIGTSIATTTIEPSTTTIETSIATTTIETSTTTIEPTTVEPSTTTTTTTDGGSMADPFAIRAILESFGEDIRASENFDSTMYEQIVNTSYMIVITLSARGYILLIMNIIFSVVLMRMAMGLSRELKRAPSLLPMIGGYPNGRPTWDNLYERTDIGNGYSNGGFADDDDRGAFPRSDSFINAEPEIKNQNPLSQGSNPYAQQINKLKPVSPNPNIVTPRVAKIGKQSGRRTPPRNVPPPNIPSNSPYIPDPDYTPPGSPLKPKSVLKPKSNYVL